MKATASHVIGWAGLSAVLGGGLFVGIQAIHPPETLASVTTGAWAAVHSLGVAMCLLNLLGLTAIYARQVERAGRLGLAGVRSAAGGRTRRRSGRETVVPRPL